MLIPGKYNASRIPRIPGFLFRIFSIALLCLLLSASIATAQETPVAALPEDTPDGLILTASATLGEFIRQGCYFPVKVTVENTGQPRTGQIRIVSEDPTRPLTATFIAECDLPSSSKKTFYLYPYFTYEDPSPALNVQYIEGNTPFLSESVELRMLTPDERLWVEVADEGSDFVFLSRMPLPSGSSFTDIARFLAEGQASLNQGWGASSQQVGTLAFPPAEPVVSWSRPGDLSDHAEGYAGVDGLILNTRRFYELSPEQNIALSDWVLSGGELIFWLGEDPNRYQGSFLTGAVDGSGWAGPSVLTEPPIRLTLPQLRAIPGLTGNRGVFGDFPATYAPQASARALIGEGGVPVLQHIQYGRGDILLSGLDLASLKLTAPAGLSDYFRYMMGYLMSVDDRQKPIIKAESGYYNPYASRGSSSNPFVERSLYRTLYNINNVLQSDNLTALPPLGSVAFFLLAYIVIVGPLNYFVLLKIRRREWLWYTIPVVVTLFIIFTYTWALETKGSRLMLTRLNIVDVFSSRDIAWESSWFGIFSPAGRKYNIQLEQGGDLIRQLEIPPAQMSYYTMTDQPYQTEVLNLIQAGTGGEAYIRDAQIRMWSELHFESEGSVSPPGRVSIEDMSVDGNHLVGKLNLAMNTELDGGFLFYYTNGGFAGKPLQLTAGAGPQNETIDFDLLLDMYASALSSSLTFSDGTNEKERNLRIAALSALSTRAFEGTLEDEIIFAGWINGSGPRALESPRVRTITDQTLVMFHLPVHLQDSNVSYVASARGRIVGLKAADTQIDIAGNLLLTDGEMVYSITLPPSAPNSALPDTLRISIGTDMTFPEFTTSLFDYSNFQWAVVPVFGYTNNRIMLRMGDYQRYLAPDSRTMTIKIEGNPEIQGDIISVNGIQIDAT